MADRVLLEEIDGPFDLAAEQAVLGAMMMDGGESGIVWVARGIVAPADFYDPRNRLVFEVILTCAERGEPLDLHNLVAELRVRERLNTIGGAQYLGELTDSIPTAAHIESYARIVADMATRRRIIAEAVRLVRKATAGGDLSTLQSGARALLETSTATTRDDLAPIAVAAKEEEARLMSDDAEGVITTGLATLDRALAGGLWDGQTVVVGARPSVGKSAIGLGFAVSAAKVCARAANGVVVFISVEMPRRPLAARAACMCIAHATPNAPVDLMSVRRKQLNTNDTRRYGAALEALDGLPLLLSDRRDITPSRVRALCLQAKARYGRVALVVIDYLQKMAPDTRYESREREVAETSRTFSALAGELACPVVLLSQLNRKATERRPTMADLRESGAIEQDADVILLAHREGQKRDLTVEKQRDGATTDEPIALGWIGAAACFVDAPDGAPGAQYAPPTRAEEYGPPDVDESFGRSYGDAE